MPESAFQSTGSQHSTTQNGQQSVQTKTNAGPPAIIFRLVAAVLGVVILCGWTLGGLAFLAG